MDLDDLDDLGLGNAPVNRPPPRSSKFLPKLVPKQEPQPNLPKPSKNPQQQDLPMEDHQEPPIPEPSTPMLDDEQDQEDRVVREIDVFFTPRLDAGAGLYVLQCPLRPLWRPYEFGDKCQEVRVNPKEGMLEVDLSVDTGSNYDHDAPERLQIEKQTLFSQRVPLETSYAVGVLVGSKLVLNPVDAVMQLRPSMAHLAPQGLKRSNTAEEINGVKDSGSAKKQGKAKTVKDAAAAGTSTSEVAEVAEESWISLDYHGTGSLVSSRYQKKMTSQESSEIQFSMNPSEYIKSLCPASAGVQNEEGSGSIRSLLSMPLEARLKKWLFEGPQLKRFSAAKHLTPKESNETVLEILQQHAWLVQGLWVPRSSAYNTKNKNVMPRDFVIGLFQKNAVVRCSDFTKLDVYQPIKKEAEHHLSVLAVYKSSSASWELKEPKDESFIRTYPDIVKKQEEKWATQERKLMEALKKGKMDRSSLRTGSKSIPKPN